MALSKASPYHSINNFQRFVLQKAPTCTSSGSGSRPTHGFKSRDPEVQEAVMAASRLQATVSHALLQLSHRCFTGASGAQHGVPLPAVRRAFSPLSQDGAARPGPSLSPLSSTISPSLMDTQVCPSPAHIFIMSPWSRIQLLI